MDLQRKLLLVLTCITIILVCHILAYSDSPQHFCGRQLSNFLGSECKIHNSLSGSKYRVRRSIVQECCKLPCSQKYLLCNYCESSNAICSNDVPDVPRNNKTETNEISPKDISKSIKKAKHKTRLQATINVFPCRKTQSRVRFTIKRIMKNMSKVNKK